MEACRDPPFADFTKPMTARIHCHVDHCSSPWKELLWKERARGELPLAQLHLRPNARRLPVSLQPVPYPYSSCIQVRWPLDKPRLSPAHFLFQDDYLGCHGQLQLPPWTHLEGGFLPTCGDCDHPDEHRSARRGFPRSERGLSLGKERLDSAGMEEKELCAETQEMMWNACLPVAENL